jgi:hypothetical protein
VGESEVTVPAEILWALAGFIAVKIFEVIAGIVKKHTELKDDTVKELQRGLKENTDAMRELKYELKSLAEKVAPLPKLEKDLNAAHLKIRELQIKGGV